MTLQELIERARADLAALLTERGDKTAALTALRDSDTLDEATVSAAIAARDALDPKIDAARARVEELESEQLRDQAAAALAEKFTPVDQSHRVCRCADHCRARGVHPRRPQLVLPRPVPGHPGR
jgi:hypothetical protein